MADTDGKTVSKGSKFLKKSKWGKIFKEDDSGAPHRQGTFKLNDDVTEFLKPSTEKQVPKIDVTIAQRWPGAHDVRAAEAAAVAAAAANNGDAGAVLSQQQQEQQQQALNYARPKRRKGLTVSFAKTAPTIIGEGGEEALDPTREISRKRAMLSRSISDKHPEMLADGRPWPGSPPAMSASGGPMQPKTVPASATAVNKNDDENFVAPPLRRAQTSHNEFSPAVQARMASASPAQPSHEASRGGFGQNATTFDPRSSDRQIRSQLPAEGPGIVVDTVQDLDPNPRQIPPGADPLYNDVSQDPSFASQAPYARGGVKKQYLGLAPVGGASPVYRKSRDMSLSEGMAFRRASSMIFKDDDDDDNNDNNDGYTLPQPKPNFQEQSIVQPPTRSNEHPTLSMRDIVASMKSPSDSSLTPPSAASPSGPSPFEDPKYMKRHSRDVTPDPASQPRQLQRPGPISPDDPMSPRNFSRGGTQPPVRPTQPPEMRSAPQQKPPQAYTPGQSNVSTRPPERQPFFRPARTDSQPETTRAPPSQTAYPPDPRRLQSGQQRAQPTRPLRPDAQLGFPAADHATLSPNNGKSTAPPQIASPQSQERLQGPWDEPAISMRNAQPPERSAMPFRPVPSQSSLQKIGPASNAIREASLSPLRDRSQEPAPSLDPTQATYMGRLNGSSSQVSSTSPQPHSQLASQLASQDSSASQLRPSAQSSVQPPPSPRIMTHASLQNSPSSNPGFTHPDQHKPDPSPLSSSNSRNGPAEYFHPAKGSATQPARSTADTLRREENARPRSAASIGSDTQLSPLSPMLSNESNPAAEAAFADFARRVAHMKGVFRLTAEKEQTADRCSPAMWARAALWWFLRGKAGLETLAQQQRRPLAPDGNPPREVLMQAHVDVAKAWWIVTDPLERFDSSDPFSPSGSNPEAIVKRAVGTLLFHFKSLSLSIGRAGLMPPTDSLIQGQDTSVWLQYPRFAPDAVAVLGGSAGKALIMDQSALSIDPYDMIPLTDSREYFCYGRYRVDAYLNTDEADTDRLPLPCMLTILRSRREYQTNIAIASQNELINIKVSPRQGEKRGVTWSDVSWKASSYGMIVRLPRGFDLSIRMHERDFRTAWNLIEYARKMDHSLRPDQGERLVNEVRLAELQYNDSANPNPFSSDKVRGCRALVFERSVPYSDGSGQRNLHRGFRLLLITEAGHKTLSNVNHDVCRDAPLFFEFLTDTTANGPVAMMVRVREESRQCRILLVFSDVGSRQQMYDVLSGLTVGQDETILGKMTLTGYNIEPATQIEGFTVDAHPSLQALQWQKLGVTNSQSDDPNSRIAPTVASEKLRIVIRHNYGCITDRLNLGKGELLVRLPCVEQPTIQIFRLPQEDMSISVDVRHSPPAVSDGIAQLLQTIITQPTIRTLTFATPADLHNFQVCISGFAVRYDGLATGFSISRRMMVVPIYKKWEASRVRLQVVARDTVVQVAAFMEDFSHADAMCFQVKSTDAFEMVKGDGKHRKSAVRIVDAKFSLPKQEKGEVEGNERVRRRFANLEGLDYAEEHDDITISFETEKGE